MKVTECALLTIVRRTAVLLRQPKLRLASLSLSLTLLSVAVPSYAKRHERLIDSWKPINYNISITFNDRLTEISSARTEITLITLKDRLSQIDLDFGEMTVDAVTVNGQTAQYERIFGKLNIKLVTAMPKQTRSLVVVSYHGVPKDGLVLTTDKSGNPSAVGDNWPDRVHHWIPCLDHPSAKAPVTFSVTAPARDAVVANGQLNRVKAGANEARTWTWTEAVPIPPYCMIIAVGEFAQLKSSRRGMIPLSYYVPQTDRNFAIQGFAPADPSLKFFSQTIAPYPYEKLALIVGATRFGGMENSSAIVFSSTLFDPRPTETVSKIFKVREGIVDVVAHEIAHQWFGDSVTESTWADLWLSEGFATYFAGLFIQRYEGEAVFRQYMAEAAEAYFKYEKNTLTPIHDTETEDLFRLLNANNYQKGAWVLHMLRSQLGDKAFFAGIRAYYLAHRNSTATTEDLRIALEKTSGVSLKDFFSRWIYSSGHPQYEATWEWEQPRPGKGILTVRLEQRQQDAAFLMPVPLEIMTAKGIVRKTINPSGKLTVVRLAVNSRPTALRLDPDSTILKEATVTPTQQ
jgi:aminopeptidase N